MTRTILVAGGGTAGHVFPALAVAAELAAQPGIEPVFVGVDDRLEARLVPEAGYRLHTIDAVAIPRRPSAALLRVPSRLRAAVRRCREIIAEEEPLAAVTFGGYVSFPLDRAAHRAGVPLVIHEQNSIPGLANRVAARWADHVAVTFPGSAKRFPREERCVVTGNPVRADLVGLDRAAGRADARTRLGLDPEVTTLLVFGGSQGAESLNQALVAAYPRLPGPLQIVHATGRRGYDDAVERWEPVVSEDGPRVTTVAFIDDMAAAYAAADVTVCRSGATSIAELTALGIPAVLVPYPHATADHQTENARALAAAGGAVTIADEELTGASLAEALTPLLADPAARREMSRNSRVFGRPDAAAQVARLTLEVAGAPDGGGS